METEHSTQSGQRKRKFFSSVFFCFITLLMGCILMSCQMQSPAIQEPVRQPVNGPQSLTPSLSIAQVLVHDYEDTVSVEEIEGSEFSYDMTQLEDSGFDDVVKAHMNAAGKIASTAYLDTDLDLLYLDYGILSADCLTYLTLDATQAGGQAAPLTGVITAGNGIHSIPYPFDDAPTYITVMGMVCVNEESYYFAQLHHQELTIIPGTTQELAQMGIGDVALWDPMQAPFVALDGMWIAAAQPTVADDEEHSYFTSAGYYNFSPDGNFTFHPVTLGKKGIWYHIEDNTDSYEGTYHYTGSIIILKYTTHNEAYFDEQLGQVGTKPVPIDASEQFTLEINQSCAAMCAVIPDHPQFGKTLIFEKSKSDDPIHALLVAINSL